MAKEQELTVSFHDDQDQDENQDPLVVKYHIESTHEEKSREIEQLKFFIQKMQWENQQLNLKLDHVQNDCYDLSTNVKRLQREVRYYKKKVNSISEPISPYQQAINNKIDKMRLNILAM